MTQWLESPYYDLPAKPPETTWVEWNLAVLVRSETEAYTKFLTAEPDTPYANRGAFVKNMIEYAERMKVESASEMAQFLTEEGYPYMDPEWDAVEAGMRYSMDTFKTLRRIPVQKGDPETNNVYDAWVNGWGHYYGGHPPADQAAAAPAPTPIKK